jgi:hypothetical protein
VELLISLHLQNLCLGGEPLECALGCSSTYTYFQPRKVKDREGQTSLGKEVLCTSKCEFHKFSHRRRCSFWNITLRIFAYNFPNVERDKLGVSIFLAAGVTMYLSRRHHVSED